MARRTLIISLVLVAVLLAVVVLWAGAASAQKANTAHRQCAMGGSMMESMHQGMKAHTAEQCPKIPECRTSGGMRGMSCGMQGHMGSGMMDHSMH